ncbi:MAG: dCTP deaminase [Candidatus Hodarchaeota archaeon]
MAILARTELLRLIHKGEIKIQPFSEDQVGPASIDLTLGDEFRTFKKARSILHAKPNFKVPINDITEKHTISEGEYFLLLPQESVHGITREKITFSDNICGWIQGRSSFARIGLMVHITASFIQPGSNNRQVLEIFNVAPIPIALYPGTRICHIILEKSLGTGKYEGRYKTQETL